MEEQIQKILNDRIDISDEFSFREGFKIGQNIIYDKIFEWLENNAVNYTDDLVKDLKKYLELWTTTK